MSVFERIFEKAAREEIPIRVQFDLTYRCHQSCIHCYLPDSYRRGHLAGQEMSTAQIRDILDQLAAAGTFWLSFSGGEIFLRSDLFDLLKYGRRRNFLISLLTSGTCGLGDNQVRALAEIGIDYLLVSIYSLEARVHDEITGVPGSWEKLQATIKRCQEVGLRLIFNCLALGTNLLGIPALQDYAKQEGIPLRLGVDLTERWDGQAHRHDLRLPPETWKNLLNLLHEKEKGESVPVPNEWKWGGCQAGLNSCYINPSGEVRPCIDIPWSCGQMTNGDSFQSAWENSLVFRQVRQIQEKLVRADEVLCDLCRRWKTPEDILYAKYDQ